MAGTDLLEGFICAAIAVLCFGSNFVPVKKYETGDGMFFQWVLCSAIWFSGLIVNIVRTSYIGLPSSIAFYPYVLFGGFLWCTGNICVVTVIKCIGLGLGMCLWGATNLLMGWASGTFGLFGVEAETVPHPMLNYVGVVLAVFGVVLFVFVKSDATKVQSDVSPSEQEQLLNLNNSAPVPESTTWVDSLGPVQKRLFGCTLAIISGLFYGVNFDPAQYLMDHTSDKSGLDYVFSHFCGIYATSTLYMIIYCIFKKNSPVVYPKVVLPGLISGFLWAIADISWFVANQKLQMVVSFPLVSAGPGLVASVWGILLFKEIRGVRNFLFLGSAFVATIIAVTLIALSKIG